MNQGQEKKKSGIFTVKEEDNETEEIKTEVYLTSEDQSSSSDGSASSKSKKSRKRRHSKESSIVKGSYSP